jgi:hypothetical protein
MEDARGSRELTSDGAAANRPLSPNWHWDGQVYLRQPVVQADVMMVAFGVAFNEAGGPFTRGGNAE